MFFKKKEKKKVEVRQEEVVEIDVEALTKEIEKLKSELSDDSNGQAYADIAKQYELLKNYDDAINYYEKCLDIDKTLGANYNRLMSLYNVKRREAAESKDNDQIQYYLNKIDSLMQLSKDVIRGKI
ncbi:hypothetical protein EDD63_12427 [Breznakia blatticola]|uniref:Uncharacterized protein n=1 Tax=Breznakia blatticola TaxID=1754012 RepID=A0A4R7ZMG6_9FIRM|nr:tetratricopeptide repeat protein [Breznakia blatticola]TDW16400.1 hypothetical protein EDD63_12427 [Breznakia blatticola]